MNDPVASARTNAPAARFGSPLAFILGAVILVSAAAAGSAFVFSGEEGTPETPAGSAGVQKSESPKASKKRSSGPKSTAKSTEQPAGARGANVEYPLPQRIKVPEGIFDGGKGWLNTSGEISLKDLRGKIVLIDFWTYCCINCIHVLPDLEFLEKKYANELVVIGVHSAKFDNEKESDNIRNAIVRYNIEHPVINDSDMIIWRKFGVRAWPSLLIIDAEGQACFLTSGEGKREILDAVIGKLVDYHKATGTLDESPIRFDLEREKLPPTPLKYPGKVLADAKSDRLYIADTNHNRIVVTTLAGKLIETIGTGAIGATDGSFSEANFDHPQGMALVGETLYVADTENHLIRVVDLKQKNVTTLAGTGEQDRVRTAGGNLRETALNSPWALIEVEGTLYICMAGPHQIWKHKLGSETIEVYAGSGMEDITNGPLASSAFAQPSGMASDGRFLYICDSEGSAIRRVPIDPAKEVGTVVGTFGLERGRSLFEFGDRDGVGNKARLQHPLGIAYKDGLLYVADSYNHKIKRVRLGKEFGDSVTWLGDGKPGDEIDPPRFDEPHGLSIAAGKLYIADTNNHRIALADLNSGRVSVLKIAGLEPPNPPPTSNSAENEGPQPTKVEVRQVAPGDVLKFEVALSLPEGYKLNKLAPVTYRLDADGEQSLLAADALGSRREAKGDGSKVTLEVPLSEKTGSATVTLSVTYRYCRDGTGGLCKVATARWLVPVEITDAARETAVKLDADPAE